MIDSFWVNPRSVSPFRFEEILKKIQVVEVTLITFFCHNSKSGVLLSRHKPKEHIIFDTFFTEFTKLKKGIILTNHFWSKTLNNPFRSTLTEYSPGQTKVPYPFGPMNNLFKNIILVWTCDFMESERLNRQCLTSCPTKIFPKFISAETKLVVFNLAHLRVSKP